MPTFNTSIPKLVTTTNTTFTMTNGNPVESTSGIFNVVEYDKTMSVDLPSFTFTGTYNELTPTIVTVDDINDLYKLEIGDTITIDAGDTSGSTLAVSTTVTDIDVTNIQFTLSASPTLVGSGTVTFASNPLAKTPLIYKLKEKVSTSGSTLKVDVYRTTYDSSVPTETLVGSFKINIEALFRLEGIEKTNNDTLTI